ncbi:unnamed protein product [Closterium sp. NIES-65]|nr:unnamed protein product [Closterium sp. NIES-65]
MTTAAPAWRMKFYPQWPELREMMAEKYAEAGVGKGIFYYVISMFPENENLAMRKALERRSNYNGDIKTYGRGPGGCVPESKWKELADEGVAPQCSRSPSEPFANRAFELILWRGFGSKKATTIMVKFPAVGYALNVVEWPLANARGQVNPALDGSETVNQQNVEVKIGHLVTWIRETYENGDTAIWDPVALAGFRMSPNVKLLIEGYESQAGTVGGEPGGGSGEWGGQRMGTRDGGEGGGDCWGGGRTPQGGGGGGGTSGGGYGRGGRGGYGIGGGCVSALSRVYPLILLPSPSSKSFPEWRAMHQTAEHCREMVRWCSDVIVMIVDVALARVVRDDLAVEMAEVEQGSGGGG